MAEVTAGHYFAGIIGLALLRQWYADGEHNEARMGELADVLDQAGEFPHSLGLNPEERDLLAGYAEWAGSYDGPNPLIAVEEPAVHPVLARLAGPGVAALDAACGTGRHARFLAKLGCRVVGVDQSAAMLEVARTKVPAARFEEGRVEDLPLGDGEMDLAVVSLALCHLADPTDAVVELARVLRPGGRLVITDPHPALATAGGQAFYGGIKPGQPQTFVRNHCHRASTWLRAFRAAGLVVEDCQEVPIDEGQIAASPAAMFYPDAVRSALTGLPSFWLWLLQHP